MKDVKFDIVEYRKLIKGFIQAGYSFSFFSDKKNRVPYVLLCHDVDFSVDMALLLAKENSTLGVKSTFFILTDTNLYNVLSHENRLKVDEIAKLGHQVGLHITAEQTQNNEKVTDIIKTYQTYFPYLQKDIVSLHRPKLDELDNKNIFDGVKTAYDKEFFIDICYASDSRCEWAYGYPLDCQTFKDKKSFQLRLHPIWWQCEGNDMYEKFKNLLELNKKIDIEELQSNIRNFDMTLIK